MSTSSPPPEPRAELLPVEESSPTRGVRLDVGRELAIVLRETADQMQAMQEATARLTELVAGSASAEKTAESLRTLSYAIKEMNDSQGQLAAELRGARRMGRLWLLVALVAAAVVAVLIYSMSGLRELQDSMREDREVIAGTATSIREELARRSRDLASEIDALADQRQRMDDSRREELQSRLEELRAEYDQQLFAAESRLGDALRENQTLATSQSAMTDSLEQIGKEMQSLRDANRKLEQDLQRTSGLLGAAEKQLERRPPAPPEPRPGEISLTPPPLSGSGSEAAGAEGASPEAGEPAAPAAGASPPAPETPDPGAAAGNEVVSYLVESASRGLGLTVVSARATQVAGIFEDVVIEKIDDGRTSRRYSGKRMKLHIDLMRQKGYLRLSGGALTIFGWRGKEQFSRDVDFDEFDIQLDVLDVDAWMRAGAAELAPRRSR